MLVLESRLLPVKPSSWKRLVLSRASNLWLPGAMLEELSWAPRTVHTQQRQRMSCSRENRSLHRFVMFSEALRIAAGRPGLCGPYRLDLEASSVSLIRIHPTKPRSHSVRFSLKYLGDTAHVFRIKNRMDGSSATCCH